MRCFFLLLRSGWLIFVGAVLPESQGNSKNLEGQVVPKKVSEKLFPWQHKSLQLTFVLCLDKCVLPLTVSTEKNSAACLSEEPLASLQSSRPLSSPSPTLQHTLTVSSHRGPIIRSHTVLYAYEQSGLRKLAHKHTAGLQIARQLPPHPSFREDSK